MVTVARAVAGVAAVQDVLRVLLTSHTFGGHLPRRVKQRNAPDTGLGGRLALDAAS